MRIQSRNVCPTVILYFAHVATVRRCLSRVGLNYLSAFLVIFKPLLAFHRSRGSSVRRMGNKTPQADGSERVVFAIVTGSQSYLRTICIDLLFPASLGLHSAASSIEAIIRWSAGRKERDGERESKKSTLNIRGIGALFLSFDFLRRST